MWKLPRQRERAKRSAPVFPIHVTDELEAMAVMVRGVGDEESEPVVYITTAGPTGYRFRYYSDTVHEKVRSLWPELSEAQVMRAARWITAQVRNQLQACAGGGDYLANMNRIRKRRNYATDWDFPVYGDWM